jgi:hypothetical protein
MASEHHEGPEAARRFEETMDRALKISKDELTKREAAYQKTKARRRRPAPSKPKSR